MKNKLMALAIIGIFVLSGVAGLTLAKSEKARGPPADTGPAEKATGNVTVINPADKYITVDFNAHEAKNNREAKGCFHWWLYDDEGNVDRYFEVDINDVTVEGMEAWFSGEVVIDTGAGWLGKTLYIYAYDAGSPGTDNDLIGWTINNGYAWAQNNAENYVTEIVAGNLVVHFYT